MHDAFQVTTVVDKLTRIESIFAHGTYINYAYIEMKWASILFLLLFRRQTAYRYWCWTVISI